jgi:hypothetical protein
MHGGVKQQRVNVLVLWKARRLQVRHLSLRRRRQHTRVKTTAPPFATKRAPHHFMASVSNGMRRGHPKL